MYVVMVSQALHYLIQCMGNSFRLLAAFISPVGDNGQTWAALSPIRCFKSHLIHVQSNIKLSKLPLMVRQGLHQLALFANSIPFNSFRSVQLVTRGLQLTVAIFNELCWRLGGGATLRWLLAVFSPPLLKSCCLLYIGRFEN